MNNINLLFVCQVFHPDTISTSQLFSKLLVETKKDGTEITVLCGYLSGSLKKKIEI